MNLAQLRAFHAVAVHGGFSAAAQELGISQPAVTQHIKAIEESAGTRLFNRQSGRTELTPDGQDLWPMIRQVVLQLDTIGLTLNRNRHLVGGHLALGVCAPHLVMPLIGRFRRDYPTIKLRLSLQNSGRLLELVAEHAVDLALVSLRRPAAGFVCHRLVTQRVLLLVPSGHRWAKRRSIAAKDLAGAAIVGREAGSMTRQLFEEGLAEHGVACPPDLVFEGREAVKEAVAAGLGLGYVLDHELGSDTRLAGVRIAGSGFQAAEYLVSSEAAARMGAVEAFVRLAVESLAGRPVRQSGEVERA